MGNEFLVFVNGRFHNNPLPKPTNRPSISREIMNDKMIPLWLSATDYEQLQPLATALRDLAEQAETTSALVIADEARAEIEAEIAAILLCALGQQPE
jgi:hypothetical protein